jgi:hypothetical protein
MGIKNFNSRRIQVRKGRNGWNQFLTCIQIFPLHSHLIFFSFASLQLSSQQKTKKCRQNMGGGGEFAPFPPTSFAYGHRILLQGQFVEDVTNYRNQNYILFIYHYTPTNAPN